MYSNVIQENGEIFTMKGAHLLNTSYSVHRVKMTRNSTSLWNNETSCTFTRLGYGLVNTLIERQVSYDTNNVPLNLQRVSAELINPLEELQPTVGNYVVTVALDLQTGSVSVHSEHLVTGGAIT